MSKNGGSEHSISSSLTSWFSTSPLLNAGFCNESKINLKKWLHWVIHTIRNTQVSHALHCRFTVYKRLVSIFLLWAWFCQCGCACARYSTCTHLHNGFNFLAFACAWKLNPCSYGTCTKLKHHVQRTKLTL